MAKKLPKVWVLLTPRVIKSDGYRIGECYNNRNDARKMKKSWEELHRYAPVQSPKVCRWREVEALALSDTSCGANLVAYHYHKFCPRCGGKIKVAK